LLISRATAAGRGPKPVREIDKCGRQPGRGFEQHQGRRQRRQLGDALPARRRLARQEAGEQEALARQARERQRGRHRRGPRQCRHHGAGRQRRPHQAEAGVGDQRHAGVAHQRHDFALFQAFDQERSGTPGVVLVIGRERARNAMAGQQLGGDAGVLAGDHVGGGEEAERAQCHVLGVADRRRHQVEAGREAAGRASCGIARRHLRATVYRPGAGR
jgi:hypothetical protein